LNVYSILKIAEDGIIWVRRAPQRSALFSAEHSFPRAKYRIPVGRIEKSSDFAATAPAASAAKVILLSSRFSGFMCQASFSLSH
jgi:hypothetical protein